MVCVPATYPYTTYIVGIRYLGMCLGTCHHIRLQVEQYCTYR